MPRALPLLFAACYAPQAPIGAPCPDGVCPTGQVCSATGRCSTTPDVDGGATDARPDAQLTVRRLADLCADNADDQDPTMTGDMLEIVWSSDRASGYELWRATRPTRAAPWSSPALVANVNSASVEQSPELSRDGLTLYFTSDRDGNYDVWVTSRASRSDSFGAPVKVAVLSSAAHEENVAVTNNVAVVDRQAASRDLFISPRASSTDPWSPPEPIAEVNTSAHDGSPFLDDDLRTLYFHRAYPHQIYVTTRPTADDAWREPLPVLSPGDSDPWLAPDGETLLFTRANDLYERSL